MKTHDHSIFSARVEIAPFCFGREVNVIREYPAYEVQEIVPVYEHPVFAYHHGNSGVGILIIFTLIVAAILSLNRKGDKP